MERTKSQLQDMLIKEIEDNKRLIKACRFALDVLIHADLPKIIKLEDHIEKGVVLCKLALIEALPDKKG